ncbi:histidine phosphatase family protein [Klebsiella sp. PL-2018]|uniref:histidine phosphatase family protein n=1 Tax=Klebsiella TaxID=570 RepID=UPI001C77D584|nr:histidine phosphatase family protein [Klebsiella sp. PL-2018]QXD01044.1 hypothetical protein MKleb_5543 [Klebsiella sp. PL-2018]
MKIILMRHGKPAYSSSRRLLSDEMFGWINQYNLSDIGSDVPPESCKRAASIASKVVCSDLPRAVSSVYALGCEPGLIDNVFREVDLPVITMPAVKLQPGCWSFIFRIMWLMGISPGAETLGDAKRRAVRATNMLIDLAKESKGPVLLIGHGINNRIIAKELISRGWEEQHRQHTGFWTMRTYEC